MSDPRSAGEPSNARARAVLKTTETEKERGYLPPKLRRKPSRASPSQPRTPGKNSGSGSGSGSGSPSPAADWTVLSFFTPSAETFKPKPYYPSSNYVPRAFRGFRNFQADAERGEGDGGGNPLTESPKPYDVAPDDPDAIFIHPPFDKLPEALLRPEAHFGGLTYALMAENPEWFLDPADFKRAAGLGPGGTDGASASASAPQNANAIAYPTALEPPRGWCPTRYRQMVEDERERAIRQLDAPTLRCTFCRRRYTGVNAKSMWRRHVLEKHRIPMSNRREGAEGGRMGGRVGAIGEGENKLSPAAALARSASVATSQRSKDDTSEGSSASCARKDG